MNFKHESVNVKDFRREAAKIVKSYGHLMPSKVPGDAKGYWHASGEWIGVADALVKGPSPTATEREWNTHNKAVDRVYKLVNWVSCVYFGTDFLYLADWQREEVFTDICWFFGYDVTRWRQHMLEYRPYYSVIAGGCLWKNVEAPKASPKASPKNTPKDTPKWYQVNVTVPVRCLILVQAPNEDQAMEEAQNEVEKRFVDEVRLDNFSDEEFELWLDVHRIEATDVREEDKS